MIPSCNKWFGSFVNELMGMGSRLDSFFGISFLLTLINVPRSFITSSVESMKQEIKIFIS